MQLFANKNGKVSAPFNVPYVALFFARKKKLQETYGFLIDSDKIFRSSKQGKMEVLWSDIKSIDETAKKFSLIYRMALCYSPNLNLVMSN